MIAFRALFAIAAALPFATLAAPAQAQVSDEIVLNILRNCAQIDDATARLACYDNNIRAAESPARSSIPGAMQAPTANSGAPLAAAGPEGFGGESVRTPDRFETPAGEADAIRARVATVAERERGVYLLTLEDGAQWLFNESVGFSYRPPSAGDSVDISRAALGSFLLSFDGQSAVRVRRIR